MNVSIAALLLLVAACRPRRFRWSICSGTFFMVYAVLQGVAVGLVVAIGRKLEDGESIYSSDGQRERERERERERDASEAGSLKTAKLGQKVGIFGLIFFLSGG